ncbi:stage II sporulation protein M [Clostridium acetireducens DSM 10703]|uniref:Stage II sporulation protein M n=1 Tax=Clostridium acetireducens DSM 10703 TaxID=1121290 RepID=A0A1E8F2N5_9CLOT|nr:stage II sporulation protein M [Clostridium acetireducens]OFI07609.1 stage II sporulation protein M [Clostridium acetireducens DSM 10703]
MLENKLFNNLGEHIRNNFLLYIINIFCICIGIVLGIYTVKYMGSFENSDLLNYLKSFTKNVTSNNIDVRLVFIQTLKNNIPIILAIWFLGLTMIGIPIVLIISLIKGFTIGFTISFIINSLGIKGIWVVMFGIVPQNMVYIPCIILMCVLSMEFSLEILKNKINNKMKINVWNRMLGYSFTFIFLSLFMFLGFFVEAYVTPGMIKIII